MAEKISVVILSKNSSKYLTEVLNALSVFYKYIKPMEENQK